jgi:hypothetical protein
MMRLPYLLTAESRHRLAMSRLYSRDRKTQTIRWGYRIDQSRSLEKSITEGEPQLLDFSPIPAQQFYRRAETVAG